MVSQTSSNVSRPAMPCARALREHGGDLACGDAAGIGRFRLFENDPLVAGEPAQSPRVAAWRILKRIVGVICQHQGETVVAPHALYPRATQEIEGRIVLAYGPKPHEVDSRRVAVARDRAGAGSRRHHGGRVGDVRGRDCVGDRRAQRSALDDNRNGERRGSACGRETRIRHSPPARQHFHEGAVVGYVEGRRRHPLLRPSRLCTGGALTF
jgi:hypothetical protein